MDLWNDVLNLKRFFHPKHLPTSRTSAFQVGRHTTVHCWIRDVFLYLYWYPTYYNWGNKAGFLGGYIPFTNRGGAPYCTGFAMNIYIFWGVKNWSPSWDQKDGTSAVFVMFDVPNISLVPKKWRNPKKKKKKQLYKLYGYTAYVMEVSPPPKKDA